MALFPRKPDDAIEAGIHVLAELREFNKTREIEHKMTLNVGAGIHIGKLMLGTIGEQERMDGTVIADAVNLAYVEQTGLNRWADDNQIVVLYPQTKKSLLMPMNPQGCWDWWGYTGDQYATKNGPQLKAVDALISHLAKR